MRLINVDALLNDIKQASLVKCNSHLTGYMDAMTIIESQPVYDVNTGGYIAAISEQIGYRKAIEDMNDLLDELKK